MTDVQLPAGRGALIFARYAYPPNELGYCGEGDGQEWLALASGETAPGTTFSGPELAERARSFDGAWPYLTFLAGTAGVADPLDPRVAEAYWVGNDLLEAVDSAEFALHARRWFGGQAGADWDCLTGETHGAVPHHSFHVFVIYPWVGLLRRTGSGQALEVLDRCRIRWGTVLSVDGDNLVVRSRPLTWDGAILALGPTRIESARWAAAGRSLLPAVHPGDVVSLHWGWVCDVLTPAQLTSLKTYTEQQLTMTNGTRS